MDVYRPSQVPRHRNVRNHWTTARCDRPAENHGKICTVREVALAVMAIASTTEDPPPKSTPECFLEVLEEIIEHQQQTILVLPEVYPLVALEAFQEVLEEHP